MKLSQQASVSKSCVSDSVEQRKIEYCIIRVIQAAFG